MDHPSEDLDSVEDTRVEDTPVVDTQVEDTPVVDTPAVVTLAEEVNELNLQKNFQNLMNIFENHQASVDQATNKSV
jgi:hypothetical protein